MLKKIKCFMVATAVLVGALSSHAAFAADSGVKVFLDGEEIMYDVPPQIVSERTMVPLSLTIEAITGSLADWDGETKTVTFSAGGHTNVHKIGENVVYVDGEAVEFDTPSQIIDSRTLVPVRMIAETSGCQVDWDGENRYVLITSPEGETEEVAPVDGDAPQIIEVTAPDGTTVKKGGELKLNVTTNGAALRVWAEGQGGEDWQGTLVDAGNEDGNPKWEIVCTPVGTGRLHIYAGNDDPETNVATEVLDITVEGDEKAEAPELLEVSAPDGTSVAEGKELKINVTTNGVALRVWVEDEDSHEWEGTLVDAGNEDGNPKWEVVCVPHATGKLHVFADDEDDSTEAATEVIEITVTEG